MKIDKSLYAPLFPGGKTLSERGAAFIRMSKEQISARGGRGCTYRDNDGKLYLGVGEQPVDQDDISKFVKAPAGSDVRDYDPINGPYQEASWTDDLGGYVAAIVPCSIPMLETNSKWYALSIQAGSSAADVRTLRKLIGPAVKAYLAVTPCQPTKPSTSRSPEASSPSPSKARSN
ncbi:hypothetical protein [Streptomyces sp. ICBB 8177]|uniref:hypothetical protein n=1 Tax=Streptomyces sp. ICBB 8177 TaxID=563922 RepID=UPI0011B80335|nr:hypothetical protein [Streptomyces sp. ICBB 8177]